MASFIRRVRKPWLLTSVLLMCACGEVVRPAEDETAEDETADDEAADDEQEPAEFRTVSVDDWTVQLSNEGVEANPDATNTMFSTPVTHGSWFTCGPDQEAEISELMPPRGDSTHAFFLAGDPAQDVQCMFAYFNFNVAADMSAYAGFGFWARFENAENVVHVSGNTNCAALSALEEGEPLPAIDWIISNDWEFHFIPFEALELDGSAMVSLDFIVGDQSASGALWVDDLGLVCDGPCPPPQ